MENIACLNDERLNERESARVNDTNVDRAKHATPDTGSEDDPPEQPMRPLKPNLIRYVIQGSSLRVGSLFVPFAQTLKWLAATSYIVADTAIANDPSSFSDK